MCACSGVGRARPSPSLAWLLLRLPRLVQRHCAVEDQWPVGLGTLTALGLVQREVAAALKLRVQRLCLGSLARAPKLRDARLATGALGNLEGVGVQRLHEVVPLLGPGVREEAVVEPYSHRHGARRVGPVDHGHLLRRSLPQRLPVVRAAQLGDLAMLVVDDLVARDGVGVAQLDGAAGRQPLEAPLRLLHEVLSLDEELPSKGQPPPRQALLFRQLDHLTLALVVRHHYSQRLQNA
mmetsp:Transcript_54252/g.161648  ORF Transcript_54252/g.161648 Transcript_54252/m.161648 type:complete len:237 (+) Transcript_54252:72-782(+)